MIKKLTTFSLTFLFTTICVVAQTITEPVIYAKSILKKYSSEAYYIVDEDEKSARVFDFANGGKMEFTTVNDLNLYIKSTDVNGILSEINTGVHETTHDFTSLYAYKLLLEGGLKNLGTSTYLCYTPYKNNPIVVRVTKVFPSAELNTVIPDDYQTERFATYVYPSKPIQGTQIHGVYGLLDEMHAYYKGTKACLDLKPFYETELEQTSANWISYFKNVYSTYFSYGEFRYFILKYLIYAKDKHPEVYEKIMENKEFKEAFLKTDKAFATLGTDIAKNKAEIIKKLKLKGMVIIDDVDKLTIDNNSALTYNENYQFFMDAMQEKEFTDMMTNLESTAPIVKIETNTSAVTIQFDATSMAESFGGITTITVTGSFNDDINDSRYMMKPVSAGSTIYEITLKLKPGKHLYKLNIDGATLNDMSSAGSMITPAPAEYENDKDNLGNSAVIIVN